jgi:hypothetical protein
MLNQIDALSHLHIASADHFAREMGHMAERVSIRSPARRAKMILMDAIYMAAKAADRYLHDVDTPAAVTIFAGLR